MPGIILASKTFSVDDQKMFAVLTGDFNPIHVDPIAARKTQAGGPVVHGAHTVLWALDKLAESGAISERPASLTVQFRNFIPVDKKVELRLLSRNDKSVRLELCLATLTLVSLVLEFGTRRSTRAVDVPDIAPNLSVPDQPANFVTIEEMTNLSGWMDIRSLADEIQRHFPHASSALGNRRTAAIALLSRLVGMTCPGLHSLFAGFVIDLTEDSHDQNRVGFKVAEGDERFRMIQMNVTGAGVNGSVQAFLRWPAVAQAPLREIMTMVSPAEFAGSTALIVGGSRGLGSLTAKILAAGGGKVIVTYAAGREDAERLRDEITDQTASDVCCAFHYDVRKAAAAQLKELDVDITHLYYFASGIIARQKETLFAPGLLDEFLQMYVKGFYDCCSYYADHGSGSLTAFYPSSVFVQSSPPDMTEYCMAKMAGEMLCASMNRAGGRVHIIVNRLPRLLTDQTASVFPVETGDPLKALLPVVRNVQSSRLAPIALP